MVLQQLQQKNIHGIDYHKKMNNSSTSGHHTITRVRNGRAKSVTGSKGSVMFGQRLLPDLMGSIVAGGQSVELCGRFYNSLIRIIIGS